MFGGSLVQTALEIHQTWLYVIPYALETAKVPEVLISVTFHDVQVRYSLPWDATVSVGANNVFEKTGPIMYSKPNSAFSYYGGYDIGRFIYMKYQQRF